MASSSSSTSLSRTWRYSVFASFHGKDVRKTFLSHLRKQFNYHGITMFDDEGIERGKTLPVALTQAIRDSRIYIVVLSKNYASSSWCLKELVEILKCKEAMGKIVMTVFHGVDPFDVRSQTGEFGIAFNETCAPNTEEERLSWNQALTHVGNIAGEHFQNWVNEAKMIEKIAKDVLDKLNITPSRDFDDMIGLDAHLKDMESLLDLDYDGVKVVAISGPAGIGKSTIARALLNLLSNRFQRSCFVDKLEGNYHSDEHGLKLSLQEQFLSKVLNHNGLQICHLGAVKENLCDQKVLIILDDVNNLNQLMALANETTWFGPGSRIVVTTKNKELLQQHGIKYTYQVGFPSDVDAIEILCKYAFKQNCRHDGFEELVARVTWLCGKLPLALRVVGSTLCGKKEDEWEDVVNRLETILDREIEDVLRVGYESLDENEQILFLHIAVFFNNEACDRVQAMFADSNLDVKHGLKILSYRSLIEISTYGERIVMHKLLQQMAIQVIRKQEPNKRQILMDTNEICDVLENDMGTRDVSGILFDISDMDEVCISEKALKRMRNLRFLKIYKSRDDGNDIMHVPLEMEFPRRLRLLDWRGYPSKCLSPTFHPENLVKLCMPESQLTYLWQGTQKLTNLKKMNLWGSIHLKELPDLSNAINLEKLELGFCKSLVEIPSSFSNLQKLRKLGMKECINLRDIPPQLNLPSLETISMNGCKKMRNFSFVSASFRTVDISYTGIDDVSALIRLWPRLKNLWIEKIGNLKGLLTYLPTDLIDIDLRYSDIERIPDCIKDLHQLKWLCLSGCRRLVSLPELPRSLEYLTADGCESLETVFFLLNRNPYSSVNFTNCLKLEQQARRAIIKSSFSHGRETIIPGREMPAKFDQRARGNLLTIPLDGNIPLSSLSQLHVCFVLSPNHQSNKCSGIAHELVCCQIGNPESEPIRTLSSFYAASHYRGRHLFMFDCDLQPINLSEVSKKKIVLKFSCREFKACGGFNIIECGAYIKTKETIEENYSSEEDYGNLINESYEIQPNEAFEDDTQLSLMEASLDGDSTDEVICEQKEKDHLDNEEEQHTHCWNWLFHYFHLSDFVRNIGNLVTGRRR